MEVTEGTPDLGVTAYWTDAEGNVVFGPNTPKEKMKSTITEAKKRKGERSGDKTNVRFETKPKIKPVLIDLLQNLLLRLLRWKRLKTTRKTKVRR